MQQDHTVSFAGKDVGRVQLTRQGLYYRIRCRCRLSGEVICRLCAESAQGRENLGIVVPMDGGFGLDTRIPVKDLGEGELRFVLVPKHDRPSVFIPISPEEPFHYIQRLKDSFLSMQNGQKGILISEEI